MTVYRYSPIAEECRTIFDDYLECRFPAHDICSRQADSVYYKMDAVRLIIAERKLKELYK
jgi:light-regulated signal transduction histidine kinase (bacteriophytochrome)